jgi:hypothetical protein
VAELALDRGEGLRVRKGRHPVLQQGQLLGVFDGDQVDARCERLADLDEGWAERDQLLAQLRPFRAPQRRFLGAARKPPLPVQPECGANLERCP